MGDRQFFTCLGWLVVGFLCLIAMVGIGLSTGGTAIVRPGDLDESVWVSNEALPWQIYPGIEQTNSASYYRLIVNRDSPPENQQWGHVAILHYNGLEEVNRAYAAIRREAEFHRQALPIDFAERGSQSAPTASFNGSDVLFVRCKTIVHMAMERDALKWMLDYARRLDRRIVEQVCEKATGASQ